ncbi:MAG: sugar phosphorylase [Verrucomicrobia bacterium]|nr:sugar phosphorylase [Verrucomicrobiota bacterium]
MNAALQPLLALLYGETAARTLQPRLHSILAAFRPRIPAALAGGARRCLSQRDALAIVYPGQVRAPGATPLRTLADLAGRHWRGLISGIHLLPFHPSSSDDGFSVKDYQAVDPGWGTWEDIARLGADFDLMVDAVFNHVSAQGQWFRDFLAGDPRYRDFFVTAEPDADLSGVVRPRALPLLTPFPGAEGLRHVWTTFSADQADLNYKNPEVLLAVIDALLRYASRGARFIRLDAVAFLWKDPGTPCIHLPQTHALVRLMRAVLDDVAPGVLLVTETNVPHLDNLTYFGDGTNEAQLVYNFALPPLVLHAFQTGNALVLTRWARSLALPSPHSAFLNFLASHDGIGLNPARGILGDADLDALVARALEGGGLISYKHLSDSSKAPYELNVNYLDALSPPAPDAPAEPAARKALTAHAIMLSLQGVPAFYFHSLVGSRGDPAGARASGIPRRINRQPLDRTRLEFELAEPGSLRALVWAGLSALLRARRRHAAFAPVAPQEVLELDFRLFAVRRREPEATRTVLCLHNVSAKTVAVPLGTLSPPASRWETVAAVAGSALAGGLARLEPFGSLWLADRAAPPPPEPAAG